MGNRQRGPPGSDGWDELEGAIKKSQRLDQLVLAVVPADFQIFEPLLIRQGTDLESIAGGHSDGITPLF